MTEDKNKSNAKQSKAPASAEVNAEADAAEMVIDLHDPDASNYVLQPTGYEVVPRVGHVPEMRFAEEAHKASDEAVGNQEAHPEINRPPAGIPQGTAPEDLPDTSGRTARRARG